MAEAKKTEPSRADELWERWRSIQLTPEQKAELRKELEAAVEKARRDGVYERLLELKGTFHLGLDLETLAELREDRDCSSWEKI